MNEEFSSFNRKKNQFAQILHSKGYLQRLQKLGSSPYFQSPLIAQFVDGLTAGLVYIKEAEHHPGDKAALQTSKGAIAYVGAKSITDNIVRHTDFLPNGHITTLSLEHPDIAEMILDDYFSEYTKQIDEKTIRNERDVVRHALDYFSGICNRYQDQAPQESTSSTAEKYGSYLTLDDVMGFEDKKELLRLRLANPLKRYKDVELLKLEKKKAKINLNFLFWGGPGTGKTHIAQAIAGEAGVPFYEYSSTDFIEGLIGKGKNAIREAYSKAAASAPSILFIDEAELIGTDRADDDAKYHRDLVNEMLTNISGIRSHDNVATVLATNMMRKMDGALINRIPIENRIYFGDVDDQTKLAIFRYNLTLWKTDENLMDDIAKIGSAITKCNARDIATLANNTCLHTLDRGGSFITLEDVHRALEKQTEVES